MSGNGAGRCSWIGLLCSHDIGYQAGVARGVSPGQDDGLANGWMSLEGRLDLPQLNAIAAILT